MNSSKTLLATSVFLLLSSAVFGVLKSRKEHNYQTVGVAAQQTAEQRSVDAEQRLKAREEKIAAAEIKVTETENGIASAEAELVKIQTEKSDLQAKLQANETQIAELQKRVEDLSKTPPNPNPGAPSMAELQAQLDEARRQLDSEHEKNLVATKLQPPREQTHDPGAAFKRPTFRGSIHGTVLAVNRAYNFVVLNLGNRQGLEANAEMLVMRGGTLIGRIRVSSVEPATAIGDILTGSLARGVQVQPGDTVIYAGTNS